MQKFKVKGQSHLKTRQTALHRGRTDRNSLTHNLDLQSPDSYGHDLLKVQKFKVTDQSVPKIEWKQTDGRTDEGARITSLANAVGNNVETNGQTDGRR